SVPQTNQWPAAAWFEVKGVQFVIYAKHLEGYNPHTNSGKFAVWISVPPQYRKQIEAQHPFGPADANAYLRRTGYSTLKAVMYKGPGDVWVEAPGHQAWTSSTDRCLLGVFEPTPGKASPSAFAMFRVLAGGKPGAPLKALVGHFQARCPDYAAGKTKPASDNWIEWRSGSQHKRFKVDQWGLPGCSPVPAGAGGAVPIAGGPHGGGSTPGSQPGGGSAETPALGPGPLGGTPGVPVDAKKFLGDWVDKAHACVLRVQDDGTWYMEAISTEPLPHRAGNWVVLGNRLILRTCLAQSGQLWVRGMPQAAALELISQTYDLTMVWELSRTGNWLVGTSRTWRCAWDRHGHIKAFKAWDDQLNRPESVRFLNAQPDSSTPPAGASFRLSPDELKQIQRVLKDMEHGQNR
ncbi:MAG: hypothetical protein J7M26_09190, partial [Armatimonadetes bacterium]|nr:hypothetical protein [Armatimonadota bacterium]